MGGDNGQGVFQKHIELLRLFLNSRERIVRGIGDLLSAQRTPNRYTQTPTALSRQFDECFFAGLPVDQSFLRSQLEQAYSAAGFEPRRVQHLHNDLIHPVEMLLRAVHCWQQTRCPGPTDRTHYAHTLFNLYVLRWLQLLSLRLWDEDLDGAGGRLADLQAVLDGLGSSSPPQQPRFVRDARWLIPLAQSLITDELAPYFDVERRVVETLSAADVLEIQRAHVRMLGGHLTSQIRYYCTKDSVPIQDRSVILRTRTTNALDLALLVHGLVGLLRAYERAVAGGDPSLRAQMAGAILQGISPDPELFLHRIDLLSAYTMIEHVFVAKDAEGHAAYSPEGRRHVQLMGEYRGLMDRMAGALRQDAPQFRPEPGRYSPYGVIFGLPSTLIEHMALKAVQREGETRFSLEDVFEDDPSPAKLAWVDGWRKLPHIPREVQRAYEYPQQFAEEIWARVEQELEAPGVRATGRLHVGSVDPGIPELADTFVVTSQTQDAGQLQRDRQEAHYLVSYGTPEGWVALKKELLTEVLGAGMDAWVAVPGVAAGVLRLMGGDLVGEFSAEP